MAEILLIDDDPELGELVRQLLEERDHHITIACTCAQARALLAANTYELLIVDGLLPDGSGIELLKELRTKRIRISAMFISALWQEVTAVASKGSKLGVARVLRKPIDPASFALEVSYALRRDRPELSTPRSTAVLEAAFAQLREKLVARVAAFEVDLARAQQAATALGPLHSEAHKLHGSAGSFGYDQVSIAAGVIEDVLAEALRARSVPDESGWRRMADATSRMTAALAHVPRLSTMPPGVFRPRVLVVEDDALLVTSLTTELSASLEVLAAGNAEMALALARSARPDCAVIDVHLGVRFQGFELAKSLRALRSREQLPIVFISADSSLETQIQGLHAGGSLFLAKPLSAPPLLDAVRRLTEAASPERPRVVLLDDDPIFCQTVQRILRRAKVELCSVQDEVQLLEVLAAEDPAFLLLDVQLNGISGLDICRMLRANPRWENLEIMMVSGDTSVEMRIAAFRAGANAYVSKPIVPEELVARVTGLIEHHRLQRERATRDNLTSLMLRGPFSESFASMLKRTERHGGQLSLCLLDLDQFKAINDRYGHMSGDRVLSTLGQLLNRRFRGEDLRCRWGGEEIVLALSGSPCAEATLALERLLAEFKSMVFDDTKFLPYHVTFSAGVASYPDDGRTLDELVAVADRRMYEGKRRGRGRVISE